MTYSHAAGALTRDAWDSDSAAFSRDSYNPRRDAIVLSTATYSPLTLSHPSWLPTARETMERLAELRSNWDSYGALPVSPTILNAAYDLLLRIVPVDAPMPAIVPTADGAVQIEWHTREIDLELRMRSPIVMNFLFEDARGAAPPIEEELQYDLTSLKTALLMLASR